ncbi:MAG TPA: alpha/beta hydrolase [Bacteroidales bacterium]|nr:alpha/beta hydrolase [Bacteroidales bacterium]HSA44519.1 alpha/beta hydrolase [Bacteroidales bacterium]
MKISCKARLINALVRNRHWFRGRLRKERFSMQTSIEGFRAQCERGASRFGKIPADVRIEEVNIEGIRAEWHHPENEASGKLILYMHGGGYVSGSCSDHRGFVARFARRCGLSCLVFEYRLAPEHPFPAALEDSVKVYRWLPGQGFFPEHVIFAGESAGGGLVLASLLAIRDRGLPMPLAAVAVSPWTDLACSGSSYRTKNRRSAAPLDSWTVFSRHYAGNEDVRNPYISPLYGDLHDLPPLFLNAGTDDELYDDAEQFFHKAKAAGVDVVFRSGEGMLHCYPFFAPMFREATEAMDEICGFVKKKFGSNHHVNDFPGNHDHLPGSAGGDPFLCFR